MVGSYYRREKKRTSQKLIIENKELRAVLGKGPALRPSCSAAASHRIVHWVKEMKRPESIAGWQG